MKTVNVTDDVHTMIKVESSKRGISIVDFIVLSCIREIERNEEKDGGRCGTT